MLVSAEKYNLFHDVLVQRSGGLRAFVPKPESTRPLPSLADSMAKEVTKRAVAAAVALQVSPERPMREKQQLCREFLCLPSALLAPAVESLLDELVPGEQAAVVAAVRFGRCQVDAGLLGDDAAQQRVATRFFEQLEVHKDPLVLLPFATRILWQEVACEQGGGQRREYAQALAELEALVAEEKEYFLDAGFSSACAWHCASAASENASLDWSTLDRALMLLKIPLLREYL